MKKLGALFLVMAMILTVAPLGGAVAESAKANTVAFCTMTAEGDYWNMLYGATEAALNDLGYEMEVINADMDLTLQIEQIENCVTQGYAGILLLAVDGGGVADASKRAVEAGCPVLAFIKDPGEGNCTASRHSDETLVGETVVEVADDWTAEHFADAAEGSVNVVIIGGNGAGSETERYDALVEYARQNPLYNILDAEQWETSQSYAMQATENLLTKYGDINLILVGSGEMALGIREAVMAQGSPITDYSTFGIFTADISAESAESIRASAADEDVIRAAAVNGGILSEACAEMAEQMVACINGTNEAEYPVSVYVATPDNLADFGF